MKKNFFFFLVVSFFLSSLSLQAVQDSAVSSVQKVIENKVYLKPGNIQIAQNGIFIMIDGQLMPIDHLEMDQEGVYFEPHRMRIENCETCGLPIAFGKCVNPACPSKKKK